jgi:hypothetical protein
LRSIDNKGVITSSTTWAGIAGAADANACCISSLEIQPASARHVNHQRKPVAAQPGLWHVTSLVKGLERSADVLVWVLVRQSALECSQGGMLAPVHSQRRRMPRAHQHVTRKALKVHAVTVCKHQ